MTAGAKPGRWSGTGTSLASGTTGKRRILVVGPVPPPTHGVSVMTQLLLDSPLAADHELVHFDTSDRRGVGNIGRFDVGNVTLALRHGTRFMRLLWSGRFDAVYVPVAPNVLGFLRDALFLIPARLQGKPLILHLHSGGYAPLLRESMPLLRVFARRLFRSASRVILLGEALRPMLHGIVPEDRAEVVPNAVPDVGERPEPRREGAVRILFVGNLIAGKGYAELIRAVEALLDEGYEVELTLAGGIADEAAHAAVLRSMRHPHRIHFAGEVDTRARTNLLFAADVLALPTYYENEGHPLVLLEAMAAGLPVVSTRHVAIPETVMHGVTGLLVEKRDVRGLVDALRQLTRDEALRVDMGRAARQRYETHFTVERWSERMRAVFERAIEG